MQRSVILAGLALAVALPLAGCATDGYGGYYGSSYGSYYPYSYGWYDGFYGPVYDGYWGNGGYYYRMHDHDHWRRDRDRHFRASPTQPGPRWQRYGRADRDGHDGRSGHRPGHH